MHALSERNDDPTQASRPLTVTATASCRLRAPASSFLKRPNRPKTRRDRPAEVVGYGLSGDAFPHHGAL